MSLIISYASLSCDDLAYSRKYNYDTDRKATQFSVMAFDILWWITLSRAHNSSLRHNNLPMKYINRWKLAVIGAK